MQALILRTMAESGESIVRFRPRLTQDNLRVPLQTSIARGGFSRPRAHHGHGQRPRDAGVQFDLLGRRVAYWIYTYHPAEC